MILFLLICVLVIIVMLCLIVYTIATGQFHALPKELIITAIPSLILFFLLKSSKNKKNITQTPSKSSEPSKGNSAENLITELPKSYIYKPLAYHYDDVKVCIIKGQEPDYTLLKEGIEVYLYTEKENQYDKTAVAVYANKSKIGYLYKGKLKDMAYDFLESDDYVYGYISKIEDGNIMLNLGYYRKIIPEYKKSTTFKLTGTAKKDIQEALLYCSEDDEVSFDFDYEKDCYEVSDSDVIGYAPKSKTALIENLSEFYAYVSKVDTDSNDKYFVEVTIKYD